MPSLHADLGPGVTALVTTRAGGVSTGPYATLDLARHVGDQAAYVATNRTILQGRVGAPVVYVNQVHGARVGLVGQAHLGTFDPELAAGAGDVRGRLRQADPHPNRVEVVA